MSPTANATSYSFKTINVPGSHDTVLFGINNLGQAVGYYTTPALAGGGYTPVAFEYSNGQYHTITVPGDNGGSVANDINDQGVIVGSSNAAGFVDNHGHFSDVSMFSEIVAINDSNVLAGNNDLKAGFIDNKGDFLPVNVPGAPNSPRINGINNLGQIVGDYADDNDTLHSFEDTNSKIRLISVPGSTYTDAICINDQGVIAGWYETGIGIPEHGFIDNNGKFTTVDVPGARGTDIYGINDRGQISGVYGNGAGLTSVEHGFIATPKL